MHLALTRRRSRLPLLLAGAVALLAALAAPVRAQTARIVERVEIDHVFSGLQVGFESLTDETARRQYVAYYNVDREMVVASRALDSRRWTKAVLPSRVGWDSHNYITLALDRDGHLHVSGNMHGSPLVYFRTTTAGDVTTLRPLNRMTGARESRSTYPKFVKNPDGDLFFFYRDGASGNGDTLCNRYDPETRTWVRLLEKPLFDGHRPASLPRPEHDDDDLMNAYPVGPILGPDGWWHLTWVWRDTPDAATNHDLGYARSRDLLRWETAAGQPLPIPISLDTPGVTLDPVPAGGAIINGTGRIGFDAQGRAVVSYHKYDDQGATQIYLARHEDGAWRIRRLTDWTYRWVPAGRGTITFDVSCSELLQDPRLGHYIRLNNTGVPADTGRGLWRVDPRTLALGEKLRPEELSTHTPSEVYRRLGDDPRLGVRINTEDSALHPGRRYLLRRETLPINRDRPPAPPIPAPSLLELITVEPSAP